MKLSGLFNTRDLGGMPTADGLRIKHGKLIRSGKLYKLSDKTVDALKQMGVDTVIDLRIFTEIEEHPDTVWEGLNYLHCPLLCTATSGITHEKSMRKTMALEARRIKDEFGSADNYMAAMYRSILLNEEPQKYLSQILRTIIEEENCVLWHCSGGKDRAGIVSMLVESLLGVDEKMIIEDYVASHEFQKKRFFWNRFGLIAFPFLTARFKKILLAMMNAKPRYLTEAMDAVKAQYGSMREYCRQALGVTDEDVAKMKEKYLEK
ncbi:MAG: tyrosine-protein phosphatase [Clostridia bacterium]|nr:tyrosine-protein phosphatase [Clostridia bacterium]